MCLFGSGSQSPCATSQFWTFSRRLELRIHKRTKWRSTTQKQTADEADTLRVTPLPPERALGLVLLQKVDDRYTMIEQVRHRAPVNCPEAGVLVEELGDTHHHRDVLGSKTRRVSLPKLKLGQLFGLVQLLALALEEQTADYVIHQYDMHLEPPQGLGRTSNPVKQRPVANVQDKRRLHRRYLCGLQRRQELSDVDRLLRLLR